MKFLNRLNLIQGIWLLIILSLLGTSGFGVYLAGKAADIVRNERVLQLEVLTESVHSLLDGYYQQEATLGREAAQQAAMQAISTMRYDGKNYFWLHDQQLNLVMHPTKPQNVGKNMRMTQDGSGKYHWQEMQRVISSQGAGEVEYNFVASDGKMYEKLSYVRQFAPWGWVIGTGIQVEAVFAAYADSLVVLAVSLGLMLLVLLPLSVIFLKRLTWRVAHVTQQINALSTGDLRPQHGLEGKDELAQISRALSKSTTAQADTAQVIQRIGNQLCDTADEVTDMTSESRLSVDNQFQQLELLSTAMNEATVSVQQVASSTEQMANIGTTTQGSAQDGQQSLQNTINLMQQLAQQVESSCQAVLTLQKDVSGIGTIIEVINGISDQTNLLALNAAIEAARAGEHGRGFAVVADEVRQLAKRTQESTGEIQTTIERLQKKGTEVSQLMEQGQEQATESVDSVGDADRQLAIIVKQMSELSDMIHQVASATEQQTSVSEEMNSNLLSIRDTAEGSTNRFVLLDERAKQMAEAGKDLQQHMSRYQLAN